MLEQLTARRVTEAAQPAHAAQARSRGNRVDALAHADDAAAVRARLVWLSAEIATLRTLCETRSLMASEAAELVELLEESSLLHGRLATLRSGSGAVGAGAPGVSALG